MNDTVLLSADGAIATITLNRPKLLNALNGEMIDAFAGALDRIEAVQALRVVILSGSCYCFIACGDIMFFT